MKLNTSANNYAALRREHTAKKDDILYPLSERLLPETMRTGILQGYQSDESQVSTEFGKSYKAVVTEYEQEQTVLGE